MTFRTYDVVIGYSEVCLSVVANSEEEALAKVELLANCADPAQEPFVCYMYVDGPQDPHRFQGQKSFQDRAGWPTYGPREVCSGCKQPLSDETHEPTFREMLADSRMPRHRQIRPASLLVVPA
jgi:hypothetical protein